MNLYDFCKESRPVARQKTLAEAVEELFHKGEIDILHYTKFLLIMEVPKNEIN